MALIVSSDPKRVRFDGRSLILPVPGMMPLRVRVASEFKGERPEHAFVTRMERRRAHASLLLLPMKDKRKNRGLVFAMDTFDPVEKQGVLLDLGLSKARLISFDDPESLFDIAEGHPELRTGLGFAALMAPGDRLVSEALGKRHLRWVFWVEKGGVVGKQLMTPSEFGHRFSYYDAPPEEVEERIAVDSHFAGLAWDALFAK